MNELCFVFLDDDYQLLKDKEQSVGEFIEVVLKPGGYDEEDPIDSIGGRFLQLFSDEGGAPDIFGIEIVDIEYNDRILQGKICFEFSILYSYTCADYNKEYEKSEYVEFRIDENTNSFYLNFFQPDKRSTHNEF